MGEEHPRELELARRSDGGSGDDPLTEHLRWCSGCRRVLADHEWLQGEIATALDAEAAAAPVPSSDWDGVRRRLRRPERQPAQRGALVAAGVALIACVMLVAPSALGRHAHAQGMSAGRVSIAPAPVIVPSAGTGMGGGASLRLSPADRAVRVSLPFVPPPTPPERGV